MGGGASTLGGSGGSESKHASINDADAKALRDALDKLDVGAVKGSINYLKVHINDNILPSDGGEEQTPLVHLLSNQDMKNAKAQEICNFLISKTIFFASQASSSESTSETTSYDADSLNLGDIAVEVKDNTNQKKLYQKLLKQKPQYFQRILRF
jgi:hypothetical protein